MAQNIGVGRKAGGGLARPVQPSAELAAITGSDPLPRSQVVSKVWDHIRKNNLQNPQNKREIVADDKLRKVFGKDRVTHVRDEQASLEPSEVEAVAIGEQGTRRQLRVPFLCDKLATRRLECPSRHSPLFSRVTGSKSALPVTAGSESACRAAGLPRVTG